MKKRSLQIQSFGMKPVKVAASVLGTWAVHPCIEGDPEGWRVTHVATTACAPAVFVSEADALAVAKVLEAQTGWDFTAQATRDRWKECQRKFKRALKRAGVSPA